MKVELKKENVVTLLKSYYKLYEQCDVEIQMEAKQECYGFYEDVRVIGIIKRRNEISVLGQTVMAESIISEEEVKGILETILQDEGYKVENIEYDTGLTHDDYPLACGSTPYFKAINVEVKKDVKQKMKGMSE